MGNHWEKWQTWRNEVLGSGYVEKGTTNLVLDQEFADSVLEVIVQTVSNPK